MSIIANLKAATRVRRSAWAASLLLAAIFWSCRDYQRYKQLETYRMLSLIAGEVDRSIATVPTAEQATFVNNTIAKYAPGSVDAWGHSFHVVSRQVGGRFDFVIVSFGSDGTRDVEDDAKYFELRERDIHRSPSSDIVFRNGAAITNAGK